MIAERDGVLRFHTNQLLHNLRWDFSLDYLGPLYLLYSLYCNLPLPSTLHISVDLHNNFATPFFIGVISEAWRWLTLDHYYRWLWFMPRPHSKRKKEREGSSKKNLFRWLGVKPKPVIPFHSGLAVHRLKSRFQLNKSTPTRYPSTTSSTKFYCAMQGRARSRSSNWIHLFHRSPAYCSYFSRAHYIMLGSLFMTSESE